MPAVGFYNRFPSTQPKSSRLGIVKGASDISVKAISRNLVSREGRADFDYVEKRAPAKIEVYFSNSKLSDSVRMLEEERILVFPEDHVDFFPDPRLGVGSQITVRRASSVLLNDNGQSITYRTWGKRVGDFLAEKEIELGEYDVITPNKSALIEPGMTINITRADDGIQVEHFYTPFNVVVKDDPWLPSGKVRIKEAGIIGDRQLKWRVVKLQGGEIKRELLEDKMVSQVRDKLVSIGTKPVGFDGPYKDWINEAAVKYGADPDAMYRVMMCESGGYPYAQTTHGKYRGLFQYDNRTWSASGWGDHDIFDPYAQINAAAKAWASRYTKWPNTSRICGDLGR